MGQIRNAETIIAHTYGATISLKLDCLAGNVVIATLRATANIGVRTEVMPT